MVRSASGKTAARAPIAVELSLDGPREVVEALAHGSALDGFGASRARTERLRDLYFDTADLALDGDELALRVRQQRDRFVQSLERRSAPVAGLFVREESEAPLPGPDPAPGMIADAALAARVRKLLRERPLIPMLEVELTRALRSVSFEGARIQLVFDVGEARVALGAFPISQVELELKRGAPRALFHLAILLCEQHSELRPALRDKTGAAVAALRGRAPEVVRARPLELAREPARGALLGAAIAECLRCVTANQPAAADGRDPEGVHQMRVGVRRLRSALRLFRDELPAGRAERLREALEPLADALGAVRDRDVFLVMLAACEQAHEVAIDGPRESCAQQRSALHEALQKQLAAPETARLFLELGLLAFGGEWHAADVEARSSLSARALARELAAGSDRRALKAGRGFDSLEPPALHRLRIRVKNARYAAELLAPLLPAKRTQRYARSAKELQQQLGIARDTAAARELLSGFAATCDPHSVGFVAGWAAREAARARAELPRAWRRFRRARRPWG